ncbi:MAG: FAD-dependent oxidoreductase [Planctomycetota bacterium]
MSRTPLIAALRRIARLATTADRLHLPGQIHPGEVRDIVAKRISRRQFLRGSMGVAAGAMLGGLLLPGCKSSGATGNDNSATGNNTRGGGGARVVIVGAGMAGTHCCYRLQKAGIMAQLYEASGRVGGRMFSDRKTFAGQGQVCELGGELINTDHAAIRGLAAELGIELDDLHAEVEAKKIEGEAFLIDGKMLGEEELVSMFRPLAASMKAEMKAANDDPEAYKALDRISVAEWLDTHNAPKDFRRLIDMAYTPEFGLAIEEQTCINMLEMLDWENPEPFRLLAASDERYHTRGGNDGIIKGMEERIDKARVHTGHALVKLGQSSNGTYELTFKQAGNTVEVQADVVVLALPYILLREIEITLELPALKRQAINELGYGTNAKLMSGFKSRVWAEKHHKWGSAVTDAGDGRLQCIWDTALGQKGEAGLITNFTGGKNGILLGEGTAEENARRIAPLIDQVFPGSAAAATFTAVRMHWPTAPFNKGSYACFKPGQIGTFYDDVASHVGKLVFCGEHTSEDFQGYMEGACESGARAATEVQAVLAGKASGG